jgi:hypothetical protein
MFPELSEHTIPLILSIIFIVLMYVDSAINKYDHTGRGYVKAFIVVYILCYLSIYMYNNIGNIMGGGMSKYGSRLREEIFTGNPNF